MLIGNIGLYIYIDGLQESLNLSFRITRLALVRFRNHIQIRYAFGRVSVTSLQLLVSFHFYRLDHYNCLRKSG